MILPHSNGQRRVCVIEYSTRIENYKHNKVFRFFVGYIELQVKVLQFSWPIENESRLKRFRLMPLHTMSKTFAPEICCIYSFKSIAENQCYFRQHSYFPVKKQAIADVGAHTRKSLDWEIASKSS